MLRNQFSKAFALCFTQKIANIATKAWMLNPCDERSDMLSFEISLMKIKNCIASSISAILFLLLLLKHFQWCTSRFVLTFGVSRVVCGAHLGLLCASGQAAMFVVNVALVEVSGSTTCEAFLCTHPLTPSSRLDKLQLLFFKSWVWPHRESNAV